METIYINTHNLPQAIITYRVHPADPHAQVWVNSVYGEDAVVHLAIINSETLDAVTIKNLLSTPQTEQETTYLTFFESAVEGFKNMPNWASWTTQQATDYIHSHILNGWTQAQVDAWIDTNVTTLAGARTAFKANAADVIEMRTLMENMSKTIIYLRDYIVQLYR